MMSSLEELTTILMRDKKVFFSYLSPEGKAFVKVRECKDYDFLEYDLEYKEGEMFEIGPAKSSDNVIQTDLEFEDMQAAGNAVLALRAKKLGVSWGGA